MDTDKLYRLAYNCLLDLSTEEGINASGKEEVFGCIFGRDSAITILKILKAHSKKPSLQLLKICHQALIGLVALQGKEFNLESGEEQGKFIHEFRKSKYEHLLTGEKPWFIYSEGVLKNYDSIDSTPLTLIALFKYWQITQDHKFLIKVLPAVELALNWIIAFGDKDKDFFLEYELPPLRRFGGLSVHSWTDSHQSIISPYGKMPKYPIAPIEVQAAAWLALKMWGNFYQASNPIFAKKIISYADKMKENFNAKFIFKTENLFFGAQALDGNKNQIRTITANPLLTLWAAYEKDGKAESILNENLIEHFVKRVFKEDLFVEDAGIRTMSSTSPTFNPKEDSYHNGSFWPVLNGLIVEGLENFGFKSAARKLKKASLSPLLHFNCPIELYIKKDGNFREYRSLSGQKGCHHQAWSAAALLDMAAI